MPLFNEEASIRKTVEEWLTELRRVEVLDFTLLLIDDGSTDSSLSIIREFEVDSKEVVVKTGPNQGHGKSCLDGYRFAFEGGFELILQLDSDGQCDPRYFPRFLETLTSSDCDAVYGLRYYRKDGYIRYLVSRVLSVIAFCKTGIWVFDPNVPYRLFRAQTLSSLLSREFTISLYNVYLALYHKSCWKLRFVSIIFRDRWGGSPSVKLGSLWTLGFQFWVESGKMKI